MSEELDQKREELNRISAEHAAAVKEMEAAKQVLDEKITNVRQLTVKLSKANEEYMRLEIVAA